jgi:MFS transporter, putative metabolite:H+ symporter
VLGDFLSSSQANTPGLQEEQAVRRLAVGEVFQGMPLTARHWLLGTALFIAFVIEAWEMMVLVLSGGLISADLRLSTTQLGTLLSALYVGMIPGALIWGKITDNIGRKRVIIASLALYGVFSFISAFSTTYSVLWWTRFVSGLALSGVLVAPFILLEELLPVRHRGRGAVCLAAGWPVGLLLAIGIVHLLHEQGWHIILGVSSLVGFWALIIAAFVPESPYWACAKGQPEVAIRSLKTIGGPNVLPSGRFELYVDNYEQGQFRHLLERGLLRPTLLQFAVNTVLSFSTWGLATWLPALLTARGLSRVQGDLFLVYTCVPMLPGYIAASWATGRFGRKPVMGWFLGLAAASGFWLAFSYSNAALYLAATGYYFFNQGAWGVWDTWMAEIYPTSVRGVGYSAGLAVQRVANAAAPVVIAVLLTNHAGFSYTVAFISAFLIVTVAITFFLPETEGIALT